MNKFSSRLTQPNETERDKSRSVSTFIETLQKKLPPSHYTLNPSIIKNYTQDHSSKEGCLPTVVLFPTQHEHLLTIMKTAIHYNIPLIPRGTGTGTTGAAIATSPHCAIISFEKMNQILEFDLQNAMIRVQPGVITKDIHTLVETYHLSYPPDPASKALCTIGGNVANNAGGPHGYKYGVTRDYVIGLKGVWGTGEAFTLGGKLLKNVTGYDLISLLVGSEGTLALLSEITLQLIPKPKYKITLGVHFESVEDALNTVSNIRQSGVTPEVIEWLDRQCLTAVSQYHHLPTPNTEIFLLFECAGSSLKIAHQETKQLIAYCKKNNATNYQIAANKQQQAHLWAIREATSLALKAASRHKQSHDISIPPAALPSLLTALKTISKETNLTVLGYGHLGDGNVHVNILNTQLTEKDWSLQLKKAETTLFNYIISLGGALSGEHGIGLTKKEYLPMAIDPHTLTYMHQIKAIFDPYSLLNPGKAI